MSDTPKNNRIKKNALEKGLVGICVSCFALCVCGAMGLTWVVKQFYPKGDVRATNFGQHATTICVFLTFWPCAVYTALTGRDLLK